MKKNYKKNIAKLFIILMLINIIFINISYGEFTDVKITGETKADFTPVKSVIETIIQILTYVGSGLSVIVLVALGIKYMLGSVEEKAEYKKTMLPYVIGAVIVFAASSITGVVYTTITSIF